METSHAARAECIVTAEDIQKAVHEHRAMKHPLFSRLKGLADSQEMSGEHFRLIASNIIARTLFTLSEILAGCTQATLDLSYLRIAESINTASDEGGHGKEERVHPKLMVDAMNNHLRKAFGGEEIDIKPIYFALQAKYLLRKLQEYLVLEKNVDVAQRNRMRTHVLFDQNLARLRFLMESIGKRTPNTSSLEEELLICDEACSALLKNEKMTDETLEYCHHQLHVLENQEPGYLSGVNFAHEEVADELFKGLYAITIPYADRYPDDSFERVTYRWMREHGPYAQQYRGEIDLAKGVEQIHAEREILKLRSLTSSQLAAALRGAMDFSERNAKVWDGIEREVFTS